MVILVATFVPLAQYVLICCLSVYRFTVCDLMDQQIYEYTLLKCKNSYSHAVVVSEQ